MEFPKFHEAKNASIEELDAIHAEVQQEIAALPKAEPFVGQPLPHEEAAALWDRLKDEEGRFTPEQHALYREGIERMRESARTQMNETMEFFIVRENGRAFWKTPNAEDLTFTEVLDGSGKQLGVITRTSNEIDEEVKTEALQGNSRIYLLHTHPTRLAASLGVSAEFARQTPPSIPDLEFMIARNIALDGTDNSLSSHGYHQVVTEAGVWSYGSRDYASLQKYFEATDAVTPVLSLLRTIYKGPMDSWVEWLNEKPERTGGRHITAEEMEQSIIGLYLLPSEVVRMAALANRAVRGNPDMPRDARKFAVGLIEAKNTYLEALRKIDPTVDERIANSVPRTDPSEYTERWGRLGIDISFKPHE